MSIAQLQASERFLEAMGPMVNDENKMRQVIFFINSMREEKTLPQMSFEELEDVCLWMSHLINCVIRLVNIMQQNHDVKYNQGEEI